MWSDFLALSGLFLVAFGAATILPFQSEIVFVALQLRGDIAIEWIVLFASVGNILGSGLNYLLGRLIERFRGRRWFPVTEAQLDRARAWYLKWGVWSLLFSWAPLGDALTIVAGVMRTNVWLFFLLVSIAKTIRYIVVAMITAAAF
ncbi:YqaA family protein [Marivita geojedonensis]|uniref:Membrane protein n=1 Tax=Marivita geojedonensis TaxID=1123756 RepID=A0A1X4NQC1_9RHOB|nr:YqaA family protein [Marivita geojedonensis]OSQ53172.1 membrane protein [Marivita geojedonensis]PRY81889.1 membrane protein YqaA with SNARE-associated domain [Marivita geojedonensis]